MCEAVFEVSLSQVSALRVAFLTGRSPVAFWGLHSCSPHPLQENLQQGRTKYLLLFATLNKSLLGWAAGAGSRAPSSVICGSVKPRNCLGSACLI